MFEIKKIHARQIMDSRGNPTIECDIELSGGAFGRAAHSVVRRYHRVHPRGHLKHWNCVTAVTPIWAKVF